MIIQAVADSLNLSIRTVELNEIYTPLTRVAPVVSQQEATIIYIGRENEIHYVSSMALENVDQNNSSNLSVSDE